MGLSLYQMGDYNYGGESVCVEYTAYFPGIVQRGKL
jgi:hypothetical protein